ncbi:MAG TPA: DedA family protein [Chloroflexota bacterium]|nr:DedA family protein [Chloroflexota bacterium]
MLTALEDTLILFFEQVYRSVGYPGLIVAMAIESACIPLPSEIVLPMAGWMVSRNVFSLWGATLAGTLGGVIGSVITYWIGARGGRPLLERYGRYILISTHDLELADRWFARYGHGAIFFSRLLPVIRTFISLPAGIARMPFGVFILYTTLGSLPWSFALIYAGKSLGDNWEAIRTVLQKFDYLVLALILAGVGLYLYRHLARGSTRTRQSTDQ